MYDVYIDPGIGTFYVSLHHFTDLTAALLTDELTNHGMTPAKDAEKVIHLAITDVKILDRFVYNCVLKMDMETNNGDKNSYTANNVSGHGHHVWGGAITSMVTELLNDYVFIDFLKK